MPEAYDPVTKSAPPTNTGVPAAIPSSPAASGRTRPRNSPAFLGGGNRSLSEPHRFEKIVAVLEAALVEQQRLGGHRVVDGDLARHPVRQVLADVEPLPRTSSGSGRRGRPARRSTAAGRSGLRRLPVLANMAFSSMSSRCIIDKGVGRVHPGHRRVKGFAVAADGEPDEAKLSDGQAVHRRILELADGLSHDAADTGPELPGRPEVDGGRPLRWWLGSAAAWPRPLSPAVFGVHDRFQRGRPEIESEELHAAPPSSPRAQRGRAHTGGSWSAACPAEISSGAREVVQDCPGTPSGVHRGRVQVPHAGPCPGGRARGPVSSASWASAVALATAPQAGRSARQAAPSTERGSLELHTQRRGGPPTCPRPRERRRRGTPRPAAPRAAPSLVRRHRQPST